MSDHAATLQRRLVAHLRATGALTEDAVAKAFLAVPRHLFLPALPLDQVYADEAIPTKYAEGHPISSSSQPAIMAIMLEQLDVRPGQRILEIGAGTGYNAALLGHLAGPEGHVTTVDLDDDLVEAARQHLAAAAAGNVTVVQADGGYGHAPGAPYDRIILTAGAWEVTPAWHAQLSPGGRLVLPLELGQGPQQSLALVRPPDPSAATWFESVSARDCGFMRLRGAFAGPEQLVTIPPWAGLSLAFSGPLPTTPETISAWIRSIHRERSTGLAVNERELWGSLALWLGLQAPNLCSLTEQPAPGQSFQLPCLFAFAGQRPTCLTLGLLGGSGLSLLCRASHGPGKGNDPNDTEPFDVGVRAYGPEGAALADELLGHLGAWHAAGRPSTEGMRVRVYPLDRPTPPAPGAMVVVKRETKLVIDWPAAG